MSGTEKRRFPRVQLNRAMSELTASLGGEVTWPNFETSRILDLSYKGLAAGRPGILPVHARQFVEVEVELGQIWKFKTRARIAWANVDWIGLEFPELPAEGHVAMSEFLDAQLIGRELKPVDREFFSPRSTFTGWFYGPNGVHIFVWLEKERGLIRVTVDFDGRQVDFTLGRKWDTGDPLVRRGLLVLSQMDKTGLPMEEFVRKLLLGE
jgi:hypothetical protein